MRVRVQGVQTHISSLAVNASSRSHARGTPDHARQELLSLEDPLAGDDLSSWVQEKSLHRGNQTPRSVERRRRALG